MEQVQANTDNTGQTSTKVQVVTMVSVSKLITKLKNRAENKATQEQDLWMQRSIDRKSHV